MNTSHSQHILHQISIGLICLGVLAGVLLGYGVLVGDAQGRVNLLYVLMLYAFLPVLALVLSLRLWLGGSGKGLVSWLFELPILPRHFNAEVMALTATGSRKAWLFYQTQWLMMSFAGGSMLVYLLLLLGSDISFVWRSTLLDAADLLPLLKALSLPWFFWPEAQPGLELLQQTRDYRLSAQITDATVLGRWWKFIFAAQCTYNLLPRTLMLLVSRYRYLQQSKALLQETTNEPPASRLNSDADDRELVPVVNSVASPFVLLNWANAAELCLQFVEQRLGTASSMVSVDPLAEFDALQINPSNQAIVVLVKSWEPPLAELGDYLLSMKESGTSADDARLYLLPMDWSELQVVPTRANHLDEWRRFCSTIPRCQLLQLEGSA